jgi:RNA polymerase sigma factor (TIGR02999 family)
MLLDAGPDEITGLMAAFRAGDNRAGGQLMERFYPELKRLAAGHLNRERQEHSWQPTLLVNELYLELIKIKALPPKGQDRDNEKAAFFALAGQIMKRLLIHHSRPISSKARKIPLWEGVSIDGESSLLEVEDLLARLAAIKPAIRSVVEMKVFEGLTAEEIAPRLECSVVTVHRYWQFARRWLQTKWEEPAAGHASTAPS